MAGVIFIICVPTEDHEKLLKSTKTQIIIAENDSVEFSERNVDNTYERKFKCKEKTQNDSMSDIPIKISPIPKSKSADILRVGEQIKQPIIHKSWDGIEAITSSIKSTCNEDCDLRDPNMPIEKVLRRILEKQNVKNAAWTKVDNGNFLQVIFPLESGNHCEGTLAVLNEYGIGQRLNSTVSVIPCSLYYKEEADSDKFDTEKEEPKIQLKNDHVKNTAWNRFVASVRARLTVAQVVEGIKANATLTFDFLILLFIATILSAISLAENNNIYLVSSMLISPMMGPVMAGTFGSVIQDRKLQKIGVQNELIGLGIATAVGFCYGIIITSVTDKYGSNSWPTSEMVSRGEVRTLWVGCLIALLSGAAVALGILGDNIASLVGVAISASLMPPAVNAGLLWAMSLVYAFAGENSSKSLVRTNYYSDDEVWELAALGGISMCLTFVNIVCIYIAGILVFKIKEVAPISAKDQSRRFWKYDIKIARDYNRTLQHEEGQALSKRLSNELAGFNATNYNAPLLGNRKLENKRKMEILTEHLCQSTELAREHRVDIGRNQNTWSPCTFAPKRPTIQELKHLYFSLLDNEPKAQRSLNYNVFPRGLQNYPWSNPGSSQIYNDENVLPQIPEDAVIDNETKPLLSQNPRLNSHAFRTTRKFVVTPAFLDANTDNVNT